MPDDADWCCAAGICCNAEKRRKKLAALLQQQVSLSDEKALAVADFMHDHFDLLPKSLGFGPALHALEEMAREHPYD